MSRMNYRTPGARLKVLLRVVSALVGGYALTALLMAVLCEALIGLGATRATAVLTATLASFACYAGLLILMFSVRSLVALWIASAIASVLVLLVL